MKTFNFFYVLMLVSMLTVTLTACGSDDNDENSSQTIVPDPDGTITKNVWWKDAWTQENLGFDGVTVQCIRGSWSTDERWAPNAKIASVGSVKGLGNITKIPTKGWGNTIACEVGCGYVVDTGKQTYGRIYVIKEIDYGVQVKYQFPFEE